DPRRRSRCVERRCDASDHRSLHDHPDPATTDAAVRLWRSRGMIYFCSQQNRRALVLQHPALNGIDYLEVCDSGSDCGKQLLITLLKDALSVTLTTSQITITGGGADAQVHPVKIAAATADSPRTITVGLDSAGDFSTYTFSLIANPSTADPPDGFDPQLSRVDFSFKAGCETAGDCAPDACC